MSDDFGFIYIFLIKCLKIHNNYHTQKIVNTNSGCISSFRHFLLCEGYRDYMCISLCFRGGNRATENIACTYKSSSLLGICTATGMALCAALYYYILCQDVDPIKCLRMVWIIN